MSVDISVEKIAKLAYLELSEDEKDSFQKQFEDILEYVNQLQEVPMTAEEATEMGRFHIQSAFYEQLKLDPSESLREEDKSEELNRLKLTNEEALKNSPKTDGLPGELLYEVPSIIDR